MEIPLGEHGTVVCVCQQAGGVVVAHLEGVGKRCIVLNRHEGRVHDKAGILHACERPVGIDAVWHEKGAALILRQHCKAAAFDHGGGAQCCALRLIGLVLGGVDDHEVWGGLVEEQLHGELDACVFLYRCGEQGAGWLRGIDDGGVIGIAGLGKVRRTEIQPVAAVEMMVSRLTGELGERFI